MDLKNLPGLSSLRDFKGSNPNINVGDNKLGALKELNDQQIDAVNSVLSFLEAQSHIAERQFKTSRNLILATIVIMIFQIGLAIWTINTTNSDQSKMIKIIDSQTQQSEAISRMSITTLELQEQVQALQKENNRLISELKK